MRSNSSEDISEDSYRFNDENMPMGRSGSPDLGKESFRALQQPIPLVNGTTSTSIAEKLNDATKCHMFELHLHLSDLNIMLKQTKDDDNSY